MEPNNNANDARGGGYPPPHPAYHPPPQQPPPQGQPPHGSAGGQPPPPQQHQHVAYYPPQHPGQHPQQHPGYGYPAVSYQNYANYPPPPAPAGGAPPPAPPPPPQGRPQGQPPGHPPVHYQYHPHAYQYDAAVYQYPPQPPPQGQEQPLMQFAPVPAGVEPGKQAQQQQQEEAAGLYEPTPVRVQPQQQMQQQVEKQVPTPTPVEPAPVQPNTAEPTQPSQKEPGTEPATETAKENAKEGEMAEPLPAKASIAFPPPTMDGAMDAESPPGEDKGQQQPQQSKMMAKEAPVAVQATAGTVVATAPAPPAEETEMDYPMKDEMASPAKPSAAAANYDDDEVFPFEFFLSHLQRYQKHHGNAYIPVSHPVYAQVLEELVAGGIEEEASKLWDRNFEKLREYKEKNRDCDVPFTDATLGKWVERQRKLHADYQRSSSLEEPTMSAESAARLDNRFARLAEVGFDFSTPLWDTRFRELVEYQKQHGHCSPPVTHPKLGVWCLNQRFNIRDMPKERVAALDGIGFVWNHNRKRSHAAWEKRYNELLQYLKENGHCNVPATHRHSKLGTWVGKQREEYKKMKDKKSSQLDKYRIDKLNAVNFQWSLQSWTNVSWDDRFEALKKFKEQNGHCKVPRNHPDFGSWPVYQKAQYKLYKEGKKSKITKEKVDKLVEIGFLEKHVPSESPTNQPVKGEYNAASYDWNTAADL